jgi:hypothetical protein
MQTEQAQASMGKRATPAMKKILACHPRVAEIHEARESMAYAR